MTFLSHMDTSPLLFLSLKSSRVPQVTRLQYLNALMASRVAQSPDPPEIKILPNSQTKLLNEKNTTQGTWHEHAAHMHETEHCVTLCVLDFLRISCVSEYLASFGMLWSLNMREQVNRECL